MKQALVELKSTDLASELTIKHHLLSDIQQRRKEAKISAVAKKYEGNRKYKLPPIQKPDDGSISDSNSPTFEIGDDKLKDYLFTPRKQKKDPTMMIMRKSTVSSTHSPTNLKKPNTAKATVLIQPVSTITQKCSKYDTYKELEARLNMDTKTPISPRTIKANREKNAALKTYFKPLSVRIPSMQALIGTKPSSAQDSPRSVHAPNTGTLSRSDSILEPFQES